MLSQLHCMFNFIPWGQILCGSLEMHELHKEI